MRKVKEDEEISPPELKNILYYASISLLALVVGGMELCLYQFLFFFSRASWR